MPDNPLLSATMTSISPYGWEFRFLGACRFRITTPSNIYLANRRKIEALFHTGSEFEYEIRGFDE